MHPDLDPRYYLSNFKRVLEDVRSRYHDLLAYNEYDFLVAFDALSQPSQALLVRLVMRRHDTYRLDTLQYAEISDHRQAAYELVDTGLIRLNLDIEVHQLSTLVTKPELVQLFAEKGVMLSMRKDDVLAVIAADDPPARSLADWLGQPGLLTIHLMCRAMTDRLRFLFFGNGYQDWSEFVVSDLGLVTYEAVALGVENRAFTSRQDIDFCWKLHSLQRMLDEGFKPVYILDCLSPPGPLGDMASYRWSKFQHRLGEAAEKARDWDVAARCYRESGYKLSRHRLMRVHEQLKNWDAAWKLANEIMLAPLNEAERQAVSRALPRLAKKVNLPAPRFSELMRSESFQLALEAPPEWTVELSTMAVMTTASISVHWVENTLFCGLFGLIFWDVIFAPVPGAFFHSFQYGPADLYHPEFVERRRLKISAAFAMLSRSDLTTRVIERFQSKLGRQNPFVVWQALSTELLVMALEHIPRVHLQSIFERMLTDLRANSSGFPDLVTFDAESGSYELIEVKGPGDRIQDNQARWMDHFQRNGIPCRVVHVSWPTA